MKRIEIAASRNYEVLMERGLLGRAGACVREACPRAEKAFLLTDDNVAPLYAEETADSLRKAKMSVHTHVMPHGEKNKTIGTWSAVLEEMCGLRFSRSDVLVALGGGVTGDLGGFAFSAESTMCRYQHPCSRWWTHRSAGKPPWI